MDMAKSYGDEAKKDACRRLYLGIIAEKKQ